MEHNETFDDNTISKSDRRAETSPANGARSKGPKTEKGKKESSRNSLKHGIYSRDILLATESEQELNALTADFLRTYLPTTIEEHELVVDMVHARWRIRRVERHEKALMNLEMARALQKAESEFVTLEADTLEALAMQRLAESATFENINRMAQRFERTYHRSRAALLRMRGLPVTPDSTTAAPDPERPPAPTANSGGSEPNSALAGLRRWFSLFAIALVIFLCTQAFIPAAAALPAMCLNIRFTEPASGAEASAKEASGAEASAKEALGAEASAKVTAALANTTPKSNRR